MPRTRRNHTLGQWGKMTGTVTPEVTRGIPHLELARAKLVEIEGEVDRLVQERSFHQARKQETTRQLQEALEEGRKVANLLRVGLRQHFGSTNEELVAFGIKPFRGRKRSRTTTSPADSTVKAGDEDPEPSGAAST
ncbi:MAG TPA: hypothetical protein VIA62_14530 [Thermoanaerobaculia bacterium]|jgi:hypothetical protein|nr:hypothetical protein [Thermoanaerobaculia bacterium]